MPLQTHPRFIMIRCPCKRLLRARWEQVGEEIQCWDCGVMTPIVIPHDQSRLVGAMLGSVRDLLRGPGGDRILLGAVVLTLALLVPRLGLILAGLLTTAGGMIFAEFVRADDPADLDRDSTIHRALWRWSLGPVALGMGLALGTILPLWVWGIGPHQPPHLTRLSLGLFVLTWVLGPMAAIVLVAPPLESATPGWPQLRSRFGPIRRHPILFLGVLLIVPVGLLLTEASLAGLFYLSRCLSLAVLDFMPHAVELFYYKGYAFEGALNYNDLPDGRFLRDYGRGLQRGYSFIGAIPPSFSTSARLDVETSSTVWSPALYRLVRVGAVLLTCLGLTLSCAVQSRCLNALAHARHRRLA